MAGKIVETLNGYRIEWIDRQRLQDLARHLLAQGLDGVGINPYNRWDGKPADLELLPDDLRALAVPFADEVGVTHERLQRLPRLEFLLLAEYTGAADIAGESFRVVRVQLTRKIRLSGIPTKRIRGRGTITSRSRCWGGIAPGATPARLKWQARGGSLRAPRAQGEIRPHREWISGRRLSHRGRNNRSEVGWRQHSAAWASAGAKTLVSK